MDTRFWGPSGWKLLHLITFASPKKDLCAFFNTLPYVLPCKFCRASLSEYYMEDPCEKADNLSRWLWRIHNKVNEKLRGQNLCKHENPPFSEVQAAYKEKLAQGCSQTVFEGWEFLFSIAENHPYSRAGSTTTPLAGCPEVSTLTTPLLRNRWNVMEAEERFIYYKKFWDLLGPALPFENWREVWLEKSKPFAADWSSTRKSTLQHLWKLRCALEKSLDLLNTTDYLSLCRQLQSVRSGCYKSTRSKTCRKKRKNE